MEGRALTAPPIVLPILAAIALTSRLSAPRLRTTAATHRKCVRAPPPLAPIPLPIGAIPRRAVRTPRPKVATQRRAVHIPRLSAATLHRAVRIPRPNVATLHPLAPAVLTRPRAAVQVAEAAVVAVLAAVEAAGHRTVVVAVGHIDKKFGTIY